MRGFVSTESGFTLTSAPALSRQESDDVLVNVEWVSLNRGERDFQWGSGEVVGWDAYGLVSETSADGHGPSVGAGVLTWGFAGAWAEQRVVSWRNLALVPDVLNALRAAALPVAGLTALHAVDLTGDVLGNRVAITGETGGVGRLAVQLAINAGAQAVAVVRDLGRAAWLERRRAKAVSRSWQQSRLTAWARSTR